MGIKIKTFKDLIHGFLATYRYASTDALLCLDFADEIYMPAGVL